MIGSSQKPVLNRELGIQWRLLPCLAVGANATRAAAALNRYEWLCSTWKIGVESVRNIALRILLLNRKVLLLPHPFSFSKCFWKPFQIKFSNWVGNNFCCPWGFRDLFNCLSKKIFLFIPLGGGTTSKLNSPLIWNKLVCVLVLRSHLQSCQLAICHQITDCTLF